MKYTCSLCGGKLKDGVCTECGMDNRKSDEMYRNCLNRSKYDHTSMGTMSHVHTEEGAENYKQPVLNENRNKSTGKSKGENPRKNSAADWKTMAGTALPKKQERKGGYKSTDLKNIKGFSSASVQKKNQPSKLIALAIRKEFRGRPSGCRCLSSEGSTSASPIWSAFRSSPMPMRRPVVGKRLPLF